MVKTLRSMTTKADEKEEPKAAGVKCRILRPKSWEVDGKVCQVGDEVMLSECDAKLLSNLKIAEPV